MKIALITIHRSTNYGAALQAFASKKNLEKYGTVDIVNYHNPKLEKHLDIIRFELNKHGILKALHDILRLFSRIKLINNFKNFSTNHFNLTKKLTKEDLNNGKLNNYDYYITGSDQIWNPNIVSSQSNIDPIYFFSFLEKNKKKFSFASSTGNYIFNNTENEKIKSLLSDFSKITLREEEGIKQINNILERNNIAKMLDPTLLISKEEWINIFNLKKIKKEKSQKYILVYSVQKMNLIDNSIKYFKSLTGYKTIAINQSLLKMKGIDKQYRSASIEKFLNLFLNAEFIITDSFHGTCFSINFSKNFISISSNERSNRMKNILDLVNLESNFIQSENQFNENLLTKSTISSDKKLEIERLKCLTLLDSFFTKTKKNKT